MTKSEEINDPLSCWNKIADDEEVFILRGKDRSSPSTILSWVKINLEKLDVDKVLDAMNVIMAMRNTKNRRQVIK